MVYLYLNVCQAQVCLSQSESSFLFMEVSDVANSSGFIPLVLKNLLFVSEIEADTLSMK